MLGHPAPADAFIARALVAVQRGETEAGSLALAEGAARASSNQRTQLMWIARLTSLFIDTGQGTGVVPEPDAPAPRFVRQAIAALTMRQARLRGSPVEPSPAPATVWSPVAFEEVAALLEGGQSAAARARLARLRVEPDPQSVTVAVQRGLLWAWIAAAEGKRAQSRELLAAALDRAVPEWLVAPFAQAGAAMADLLDELPGPGDEFRRLVVRRARAAGGSRHQPIADELTSRELELLAYLPSRLTIAEIAARCFVSTNTVKTHLAHIYRKLEVTGRDAAIARAGELGLLDEAEIAHTG